MRKVRYIRSALYYMAHLELLSKPKMFAKAVKKLKSLKYNTSEINGHRCSTWCWWGHMSVKKCTKHLIMLACTW